MSEKDTNSPSGKPDADPKGQPGGSGNGKDPLTQLLDSYEAGGDKGEGDGKGAKPSGGDGKPTVEDRLAALEAENADLKSQMVGKEDAAAEAEILKEVRANHKVPETDTRGWMAEQLESNPKLKTIFDKRDEAPGAYREMIDGLKTRYAEHVDKEFSKPDSTGSKVRASKESTGPTGPSEEYNKVKWGELGNSEFETQKAGLFKELGDQPLFG